MKRTAAVVFVVCLLAGCHLTPEQRARMIQVGAQMQADGARMQAEAARQQAQQPPPPTPVGMGPMPCPIDGSVSIFAGNSRPDPITGVLLNEYKCPRGHIFWVKAFN